MNKQIKMLCGFLALSCFSAIASGEVKLIANEQLGTSSISAQEAADVFLGKTSNISGTKVTPIDQSAGEAPRDEFYQKVANKNAAQLKSYWSGLIFTGKGVPPKSVLDDEEMVEYVSENPDAIGYVSGDANLAGVKVLLSAP